MNSNASYHSIEILQYILSRVGRRPINFIHYYFLNNPASRIDINNNSYLENMKISFFIFSIYVFVNKFRCRSFWGTVGWYFRFYSFIIPSIILFISFENSIVFSLESLKKRLLFGKIQTVSFSPNFGANGSGSDCS